ncbi:MAG: mechanosensitive ion channel [Deltaproteobacteria bacterium]|nr:mechanosensitive ion channel [Deltaproteobacteria bacterium]
MCTPSQQSKTWLSVACLLVLLLMLIIKPGPVSGLEDNSWKKALQQLQEAFQTIRIELRDYDAKLNLEFKDLKKGLARLEKKKGQMLLWFGGSYDPKDLNHLLKGMRTLRRQAEGLLKSFGEMERRLEIFEPKLDEIEAEIKRQLVETPNQEYANSFTSSLTEITDLRVELDKVKTHIVRAHTLYDDFNKRLKDCESSADAKVSRYWRIYYLQPMSGIFSTDTWKSFRKDIKQWVGALKIVKESLGEKREWLRTRNALLQGLLLGAALILLGFFLIKRVGIKTGFTSTITHLLPSWILLSLGAATLWIDRSIPFTLYDISSALNEIVVSAGLVSLCSFLHSVGRGNQPAHIHKNPLWYLWIILAFGLSLEALGLPHAISLICWPLVLFFMGWRLYRFSSAAEGKPERLWTSLSLYVLSVLALFTLLGFATLSFTIAVGLFYSFLAVALGLEIWRLLQIWETWAKESGQSLHVIGCLSGIGFPCVILGFVFLNLWLVSLRLGGEHVFLEILSFQVNWQDFSLTLGRVTFIIVGFYLTKTAIFLSETFLTGLPRRRPDLDKVVVESLLTLIRYVWWAFFGVYLLFLLGMDLTNLAVIAGGLSVGIGFGLQHIVNNFFSGLILLIGRSIQSGDTIQIGNILGDVRKVTIRNTVVQTRDNATLFIPNSDLITNQLINWSHRDRRVVREVRVGVAYGTDTERVRELLLQAVKSHPQVLAHPTPTVFFWDFGTSTLDFKVRFWIKNVDNDNRVLSDTRYEIDRLFKESGIEIAYPQSDIHLRTAPALEKLWPTDK